MVKLSGKGMVFPQSLNSEDEETDDCPINPSERQIYHWWQVNPFDTCHEVYHYVRPSVAASGKEIGAGNTVRVFPIYAGQILRQMPHGEGRAYFCFYGDLKAWYLVDTLGRDDETKKNSMERRGVSPESQTLVSRKKRKKARKGD